MSNYEPHGGQQPVGQAQPGWYPTGDGWQRYWDGTQWTEHQAPVAAAATPYYQARNASDENMLAVITHIGGALVGFLVPLIIYLIKKDESPYLRHHAAEALNFHITFAIAMMVSFVLVLVLIGFVLMLLLIPIFWVFTIIAAVAANRGEYYRYPLTIRIIT